MSSALVILGLNNRLAKGHGGRRTNSAGRRRAIDQPPPPVDRPSAFGGPAGRRGAAPVVAVEEARNLAARVREHARELEERLSRDPMTGENPLPVPPVVAPNQTRHVVTDNHKKKDRLCDASWPRCQKMASACGGFKKGDSSEAGKDAVLTAEELETKRRRKQEIDRIRSAERRAEKKRQRE